MASPGKAVTLLTAAQQYGAHVLLLQDVGSPAVWAGAVDGDGGGHVGWDIRVRPAFKGGVAVAVRTDVPPFLRIKGERGGANALTVDVDMTGGWSVQYFTSCSFTSLYWQPSAPPTSAAALAVQDALVGADAVLHILGGDVNACLGTWAVGDALPPGAGDAAPVQYAHVEDGVMAADSTLAAYRPRAALLMRATRAGALTALDGLLEAAHPTRTAVGVGTVLSHVWGTAAVRDALACCHVVYEDMDRFGTPGAAALAAVGSDHYPLRLDVTCEVPPVLAAGAAAAAPPAYVRVPAPAPLPAPLPPTPTGRKEWNAALLERLLTALDGAYSPALRAALAHADAAHRRGAVNTLAEALTAALTPAAGAGAEAPRTRGTKRPLRIPADVVARAAPALRLAANAIEAGLGGSRAVRAAHSAVYRSALASAVQPAVMAAAAGRGAALSTLRRKAGELKVAVLRAVCEALGMDPPEDSSCSLPTRLVRPGHADLLCPAGADAATCAAMAVALQAEVLPALPPEAPLPVWATPPPPLPGQAPGLDLGALATVAPAGVAGLDETSAAMLDAPFTPGEVAGGIRAMKANVAHGSDGLKAEHLKTAHPAVLPALAYLFNAILHSRLLPDLWRCGRLLALPKRPGAELGKDFRPLTIGATLRKLLATLLLRRLAPKCEAAGIPGQGQHAYRKGTHRGTATALLALRGAVVRVYRVHGGKALIICMDVSKAFDTLPQDVLRAALLGMGLTEGEVAVLGILYQGSLARLEASTPHGVLAPEAPAEVRQGVAQGCPLSGLLFAIAMHSVEVAVREALQTLPGDFVGDVVLYADDIVGVVADEAGAAVFVAAVMEAVQRVGLRIGLHKCAAQRVGAAPEAAGGAAAPAGDQAGPGPGPAASITLHVPGAPDGGVVHLPLHSPLKVLGVLLDEEESGLPHAKARAQQCVGVAHRLVADGLHAGTVDTGTLRDLWRTYLEPVLLWGCEQYPNAAVLRVLEEGQLRAAAVLARVSLSAASKSGLFTELDMRPAKEEALARTVGLIARIKAALQGTPTAGGLRQLLRHVRDGVGADWTRATATTLGTLADVQAWLRATGTARVRRPNPRTMDPLWLNVNGRDVPSGRLPLRPWWGGNTAVGLAVLLLRLAAWPVTGGICDCGRGRPSRNHVLFWCHAFAVQRPALAGFCAVAGRGPAALHALLGTHPACLEEALRAPVEAGHTWLLAHFAGASDFMEELLSKWRQDGQGHRLLV